MVSAVEVQAWSTSFIPLDWTGGIINPIYKSKGDRKDCKNYRRITLLNVLCKVFACLLINLTCDHLFLTQSPEQAGFMPKRSTIDRILGLWVLIWCHLQYQQGFSAAYVNRWIGEHFFWDLLFERENPAETL